MAKKKVDAGNGKRRKERAAPVTGATSVPAPSAMQEEAPPLPERNGKIKLTALEDFEEHRQSHHADLKNAVRTAPRPPGKANGKAARAPAAPAASAASAPPGRRKTATRPTTGEIRKHYVIDTNVLLEDPGCIEQLRSDNENACYLPQTVLQELDKLKRQPAKAHLVSRAVSAVEAAVLHGHLRVVTGDYQALALPSSAPEVKSSPDQYIIADARSLLATVPREEPVVLVSNDRLLRIMADTSSGLRSEEYRCSIPFRSESERYTGFVTPADVVPNSFTWEGAYPVFHDRALDTQEVKFAPTPWNIVPRDVYQALAMRLMLDPDIPLVSLQSTAGKGKTFLALGCALEMVLKEKRHKRIFISKPLVEIGPKLGYLPGDLTEKTDPYMEYIVDLMLKLHNEHRRAPNALAAMPNGTSLSRLNPKVIQVLPINYTRGRNLEDCVVILDETQNLSREDLRTLLTRMGRNVKVICMGDTQQVDAPFNSPENNGLNWLVRLLRGNPGYAHLVLRGRKSRGPITDMVVAAGL